MIQKKRSQRKENEKTELREIMPTKIEKQRGPKKRINARKRGVKKRAGKKNEYNRQRRKGREKEIKKSAKNMQKNEHEKRA